MSTEVLDQTLSTVKVRVEKDAFSGAGPTQTLRASVQGEEVLVAKYEREFVEWITPIFEGLCKLLELPPNWDSYGAPQIEKQSIVTALEIIATSPDTPKPSIVPTVYGGVQFEWHRGGMDLEIEINPQAKGNIFFKDQQEILVDKECYPQAEIQLINKLMKGLVSKI